MKQSGEERKGKAGQKQTAYVTKRVLERAAGSAIRLAAKKAMAVAGYVVKAENGWVVRVDQNGHTTKISKIGNATSSLPLALD